MRIVSFMCLENFFYTETHHRLYRKTITKFIYAKSEIDKFNFPFLNKNINKAILYEQL